MNKVLTFTIATIWGIGSLSLAEAVEPVDSFAHPSLQAREVQRERTPLCYEKGAKEKDVDYRYYVSGGVFQEAECLYGQKHGSFYQYDPQGNLQIKSTYLEGKLNGFYDQYYANGNVRKEYVYKEGKKEGIQLENDPNGKPLGQQEYKNGIALGKPLIYEEDGEASVKRTFQVEADPLSEPQSSLDVVDKISAKRLEQYQAKQLESKAGYQPYVRK